MKRNPFKSEADAFRLLVIFFSAAAVVIAVAELWRPVAAAVLGMVMLAFAGYHAVRWLREGFGEPEESRRKAQGPGPGPTS